MVMKIHGLWEYHHIKFLPNIKIHEFVISYKLEILASISE